MFVFHSATKREGCVSLALNYFFPQPAQRRHSELHNDICVDAREIRGKGFKDERLKPFEATEKEKQRSVIV
jgi:DNA-directed RNA polymerase beta' subunit